MLLYRLIQTLCRFFYTRIDGFGNVSICDLSELCCTYFFTERSQYPSTWRHSLNSDKKVWRKRTICVCIKFIYYSPVIKERAMIIWQIQNIFFSVEEATECSSESEQMNYIFSCEREIWLGVWKRLRRSANMRITIKFIPVLSLLRDKCKR